MAISYPKRLASNYNASKRGYSERIVISAAFESVDEGPYLPGRGLIIEAIH